MSRKLKLVAIAAVMLAALLMLTRTGEAYKHDGQGHSALYAGVRHVWRIELQGNRDARRKFALVRGYCVNDGNSPAGCVARAFGKSMLGL